MPGAAAAACETWAAALQAAQVNNLSEWREFDAAGHQLVHETGTLSGPELSVSWRCGHWNLQGQMTEMNGSRSYDGQTSTGQPITSRSAVRQRQGQLQAKWKIDDAWQLGGRVVGQTLWRDMASAGGALGYPERYDWTLLSLGAQWQSAPGPSQLTLAAWFAAPLSSNLTLRLPGRDRTNLPMGVIKQVELLMAWQVQLRPAWYLRADVRYRRTDLGLGANGVIRRNGVPVGMAYQPRTVLLDMPVAIQIGYEF